MSDKPAWDDKKATAMIGGRILIGITYKGPTNSSLEQMFGTIISANAHEGFKIKLEGKRAGEIYSLPPHPEAFHPAPAGEYQLKSTGEMIVDPDYTTTWVIEGQPPSNLKN